MSKKTLVFGSGGREHALAYTLGKDSQVVVAPGNAGIAFETECMEMVDYSIQSHVAMAKRIQPDLVVVGPEEPLALGVVDALENAGFCVFGPSQACARLEASKAFAKEVGQHARIPSARFSCVSSMASAKEALWDWQGPVVVKADGLCSGKGVVVAQDTAEALHVVDCFLGESDGTPRFGEASKQILLEEFLEGEEISVIGLSDGWNVELFAPVRDHKRLLDGNLGPNTGGMGVVGPLEPFQGFLERVKEQIFHPLLWQMRNMGTPYRGFLYAGLMVLDSQIWLLEWNVRLGDPEAEALLFGISRGSLFDILHATASGDRLKNDIGLSQMMPTVCVVMACAGYPRLPEIGDPILGLEQLPKSPDQKVFFAGVKQWGGSLYTASGRVLVCTARSKSLLEAVSNCHVMVKTIQFRNCQYRKDIGRWA